MKRHAGCVQGGHHHSTTTRPNTHETPHTHDDAVTAGSGPLAMRSGDGDIGRRQGGTTTTSRNIQDTSVDVFPTFATSLEWYPDAHTARNKLVHGTRHKPVWYGYGVNPSPPRWRVPQVGVWCQPFPPTGQPMSCLRSGMGILMAITIIFGFHDRSRSASD